MDEEKSELVAKVPPVTFLFWIVKIIATTLGETAGDAVTMSWLGETTSEAKGTGYLIGTGIFGIIFIVAVLVQIGAKKFHPFLYWLTIVATTTVGTTLADYCTRSLGIGYTGGSTILLICVIASLLIWRWSTGSISIETVSTAKVEIFYWVTIMTVSPERVLASRRSCVIEQTLLRDQHKRALGNSSARNIAFRCRNFINAAAEMNCSCATAGFRFP